MFDLRRVCLVCDLCLVVIVIVCYLGFVNSVVAFGFCCYLIIYKLGGFWFVRGFSVP